MLRFTLLTYAVSFILCWLGFDSSILLYTTAGIIHESGHILASKLLNMRVSSPKIKVFRAVIDLYSEDTISVILTALSGPMANILSSITVLLIMREKARTFAVISLFAAVFNLLPIYPLDGSTILNEMLSAFLPNIKNNKNEARSILCDTISYVFLFSLTLVSVYRMLKYGDSLLIFLMLLRCFYAVFSQKSRKDHA